MPRKRYSTEQTAQRSLSIQLMLERLEGGEGLVVLRTGVGALETLPPHRLLTRGQVTHHVLALQSRALAR